MRRVERISRSDADERPEELAVIENNVTADDKEEKLGFLLGS
jgi:hypothetical protein